MNSIMPMNEGGATEMDITEEEKKKKTIQDYLMQIKAQQQVEQDGVQQMEGERNKQNLVTNLIESGANLLTANSRAIGDAKIDNRIFDSLKQKADQDLAAKRMERQEAVKRYLMAKNMMDADSERDLQADRLKANDEWRQHVYENDQEWKQKTFDASQANAKASQEIQRDRIAATKQTNDVAKQQREDDKEAKAAEQLEALKVGELGIARTKEDAKKLKDAVEMKAKFDRQIDELIKLREDKGVEYWDREAVGRGKQLSKDILLTYKNLAKLGVLSKSDEDIINAIIPSDPLGNDWMPGQDSILHRLKSFKGDLDADYNTTLKNRLRDGSPGAAEKTPDYVNDKEARKKRIEELRKKAETFDNSKLPGT